MAAYECKTLYQAQTSTGYQIVLTLARSYVSILSNGGTVWVRPRFTTETSGTTPTSPIPSNGVVASWARLLDGDTLALGGEFSNALLGHGSQTISFLDVWCESGPADVVVVGATRVDGS